MLTSALLVARNCLVTAFPDHSATVTSSLVYKAFVHWPLTVAHTLAVFARRERAFYLAALAALLTYAVMALTGVLVWPNLVFDESGIDTYKFVALVVVPLFILVPGMSAAWARANRHRGQSVLAQVSLVLLSVVSLVLFLVVLAAFAAAWSATSDLLRQWVNAVTGSTDGIDNWVATYPLIAVVVVLVFVVPALRGFIQARAARAVSSSFLPEWRFWRRKKTPEMRKSR
jgi:hypothetical protein